MFGYRWNRSSRWACLGMALVGVIMGYRWFSPGLGVLRGPRTGGAAYDAGRELFVREWSPNDPLAGGDGLGPVFNETSCAACHNQGGLGGGGGLEHNVQAFSVIGHRFDKRFYSGQVHAFATDPAWRESPELVRTIYPNVLGGLVDEGRTKSAPLDPVTITSMNSTALFGAGWLDRIPEQAVRYEARRQAMASVKREITGDFSAVPAGRVRELPGGRAGRFGWKAQFATLKEFVAAACGDELGLGTPDRAQAAPLRQQLEAKRTGDQAEPVEADLDDKQFDSLVAFVAGLPRPRQVMPSDRAERALVEHGEKAFHAIGCASCHTPDLGGVEGVYSDLLLHEIEDRNTGVYYAVDQLETPLPAHHPRPEEWRTAPLWGVASSAPYFHDGASGTLESAILRHQGAAREVTKRYKGLGDGKRAILAFLGTLKAPADAEPAPGGSAATTARRE